MAVPTTQAVQPGGRGLPARVHHPPKPDRKRGHQTSVRERQAVVAVAVLAGVAGAFSSASPTSYTATDVVFRAGTAVIISLAASRARRWTWLVLAGLSVVAAPPGLWFAVTAGGLVVAFATTLLSRRRIYGAIVGACASQGLLRFTEVGHGRSTTVLFVIAVAPVLVSAYMVAPRRVRRKIHWALLGVAALALLATIAFGVGTLLAYGSIQAGERNARSGLASARDGRGADAAAALQEASGSFARANELLEAWWVKPAGGVPFVAQQLQALQVVTASGRDLSSAAATSAAQADVQQLKYVDGRIDVEKLQSLAGPLDTTAAVFGRAAADIHQVRSPWLLPPLRSGIDELADELDASLPQVQLAASSARHGPALLGAGGAKHYLVLFTQPAESRGLGGFVGNWTELSAIDGRVDIVASGRADDLNRAPDNGGRVITTPPVPADYLSRYARFQPGEHFQDITMSPDLPSVAAAAGQLYPAMGGEPIDGVLVVDPYALAALLQFTGPITVDGLDQKLTADNAADILVRDQYLTFASNEQRKELLDSASRKAFEILVHGSLPSPKKVADVLGPMVEQRRLLFTAFDPDAKELLARVGLDGAFPAPDGGDFFQVTTTNNAQNKIDLYMRREIDYEATYNASTGDVEATMTVTIHNDAPADGLPPAVIGNNDQGLPPGTNRLYLSVYTPLGLRAATDGGRPVSLEFQHELGYSVYSEYLDVPAGGTATLELSLFGQIDASSVYRLRVGAQPLVQPDEVRFHLRPLAGWEVDKASELVNVDSARAAVSALVRPTSEVQLTTSLVRP